MHRWVAPHGEKSVELLADGMLCKRLLPKPPGWCCCVCRQIDPQHAPPVANMALLHALAKQRLPCLTDMHAESLVMRTLALLLNVLCCLRCCTCSGTVLQWDFVLPCMLWLGTGLSKSRHLPASSCHGGRLGRVLHDGPASDVQVLARLYAVQPAVVAPSSQSTSTSVQHVRGCRPRWLCLRPSFLTHLFDQVQVCTFVQVVLPAVSAFLKPAQGLAAAALIQLTKLEDLYRIFERC